MKSFKSKLILSYFLLNLILISTSVQGKPTQVIYPLEDAFIGDRYPDFNTGDDPWLWICNDMNTTVGICNTLIYFVLPSDYNEYDTISFHFYIILDQSQLTFNIDVYRVIQSWNESTVNWNDRPSLGSFLFSSQLSSGYSYGIDIKEHVTSNVFSICVLASFYQYNLGQIPSKEGSYGEDHFPTITLSDSILSNIPLELIIGLLSGAITGLSVIGFLIYRWRTNTSNRKK